MVLLLGASAFGQSLSIEPHGNSFQARACPLPETAPAKGWPSLLAVYAGAGDVPPLLGAYTVEARCLVFHPRFPFASGVRYRAVFHPPGGAPIEKFFDAPSPHAAPVARVLQVYPSAAVLPSNQLRLYVYFSAPMSRGEADQRIHLLDSHGKALADVFLPREELWDREYRRLTLTFDPGRIKRGLASNQALGPPLVEGKRYTLVIDRAWPDARGVPMLEGFRKSFRGGPAERVPPDPKQWRLIPPKAGALDAVVVDFPQPMNYPLLLSMLHVTDGGADIAGRVTVAKQETEWRFTPSAPWKPGHYQVVVDTRLEDLAGNHIGQAFDIDVFQHVTSRITSKKISLPFVIP
jgi:hypothetical protein